MYDARQEMRDRVVKRLTDKGWITKAVFVDSGESKYAYKIAWTQEGIAKMQTLHSLLRELGFYNGPRAGYIGGEPDELLTLIGSCVLEHGEQAKPANVTFGAGEVIKYGRHPDAEYQELQSKLLEAMEQKQPTEAIENELEQRFLEHFGIPPKKYQLDFPVGEFSDLETENITDHYRCFRGLGVFDVIVTHPYDWSNITPQHLQNAFAKYQLFCIIEAHEWGYYKPRSAGCYMLIRFRNDEHRRPKKKNGE